MMTEFEHIVINALPVEARRKTQRFEVLGKREEFLGRIHFLPRWRQYVFSPSRLTLFSAGCLDDISGFVKRLNQERRDD